MGRPQSKALAAAENTKGGREGGRKGWERTGSAAAEDGSAGVKRSPHGAYSAAQSFRIGGRHVGQAVVEARPAHARQVLHIRRGARYQ